MYRIIMLPPSSRYTDPNFCYVPDNQSLTADSVRMFLITPNPPRINNFSGWSKITPSWGIAGKQEYLYYSTGLMNLTVQETALSLFLSHLGDKTTFTNCFSYVSLVLQDERRDSTLQQTIHPFNVCEQSPSILKYSQQKVFSHLC